MAYSKLYTIDAGPGGDTVRDVIVTKIDGNIDTIFANLNTHEALTTGVHGVGSGTIVGTALTQTLTNKTISGGTFTGSVTATNLILTGYTPVISGVTITSAALTGNTTYYLPVLTTADIRGTTLSGTVTWTTPQLTNPTINNATLSGTITCGTLLNPTLSGTITCGTLKNPTLSGTVTATGVSWIGLPAATEVTNGTITNSTLTGTITSTSGIIIGATLSNLTISVASSTNGDMWYQASGVLARLPKGTVSQHLLMNSLATIPEWSSPMKQGTITRALDAVSADVAYTSIGFKPSYIMFVGGCNGKGMSNGYSDGTIHYCTEVSYANVAGVLTTVCVYIQCSSTQSQTALVKTFDTDGFTLTWTLTGTGTTGTMSFSYLAFR